MSDYVPVHSNKSINSMKDVLEWTDDFLGDALNETWTEAGGAGGDADVVDGETGGVCRITTDGDNNDAWEIDWGTIATLLVTKRVCMEVRAKFNDNANSGAYLNLWGDGTNYIRMYSDSGGNWQIQCTDGGAGAAADSGVAPDDSYHIFRIACATDGSNHVHFYIDGTECGNSPITSNVPDDATDHFYPRIYFQTKNAAVETFDVDYVAIRQDI